jgi:poly(3-hydroxybutyrate) depolymerase
MVQHWQSVMDLCVVVCPNALSNPGRWATQWEFAEPGAAVVPTVDLRFTEAILDWLRATGVVDMQRVYASGFSSGGNFTWQLTQLNRSVNWFRGYAPVSAVPNTSMMALSDPAATTTPKPLAFTMGQPTTTGRGSPSVHTDAARRGSGLITRNRVLDPNPPVLYSCTRRVPNLEPRPGSFGVEQLYPNDPTIANSAAISFLTVVNGSPRLAADGRAIDWASLVTHDIDWTQTVVSFWNTYAGMDWSIRPAWTRC